MGIGLFAEPENLKEDHAARAVDLVRKAVKAANSYFEARAELAARGSNLSVLNRSASLYARYQLGAQAARDELLGAFAATLGWSEDHEVRLASKILAVDLISEHRGLGGRRREPDEEGLWTTVKELTGESYVGRVREVEGVCAWIS